MYNADLDMEYITLQSAVLFIISRYGSRTPTLKLSHKLNITFGNPANVHTLMRMTIPQKRV